MTTYKTFNALLKIAEDEESPHSDFIDVERQRSKEYDDKKRAERKAKLKRKSELAAKSTQAAREAVAANEPSKVLGDAWDIFKDDAKNKIGRVYNKGKQVVNGTINFSTVVQMRRRSRRSSSIMRRGLQVG